MSVEPIRPEDHSVWQPFMGEAVEPERFVAHLANTTIPSALAEAIHQTFERDAETFAAWERSVEHWESLDLVVVHHDGLPPYKQGKGVVSGGYRPVFKSAPDPDTEIDRIARLIVQGEYRRRQEQETK